MKKNKSPARVLALDENFLTIFKAAPEPWLVLLAETNSKRTDGE